jgi:hypothetical protein
MLYTFLHSSSHVDHDPTHARGVTVGAGVGVVVGSAVGSGVGVGVGAAVHLPSPTTQSIVTSAAFTQSSPLMRCTFVQSTSHSVYSSAQAPHAPSLHTSSAPLLVTHSDPVPCFVTEMPYAFVHCVPHPDQPPTQSRGVTLGAGVGVGVGSAVGSTVGTGVGGAVHAPSPTAHCVVTTLGLGQRSPLMRCIFVQSTPHSVYSSLHDTHTPPLHTSRAP